MKTKIKKAIKKIVKYIKNPLGIIVILIRALKIDMEDEKFIKLMYKAEFGCELNLEAPVTLNEKLQWLKIYDRNPKYTKLVDKYETKKHVANVIGKEYLIPTLGIWENFKDIDFQKLPNQFVLKCTHDSGGTVICKDKSEFNIKKAKKKINKSLKRNYYFWGREWPYKNVKPRIIAEQYMENKDGSSIVDYKFYCFSGKCDYVMLCMNRASGSTKFYYYDRQWNIRKEMSKDGKELGIRNIEFDKPTNLDRMFEIAEKLSYGLKFVRIDLYNINGNIYFGEYTFYPSAGFDNTRTIECDNILTEQLNVKE